MRAIDKLKSFFGIRQKTYFNQGNWVDSNASGNIHSTGGGRMYWYPGTRYNWSQLTGELWTCPTVQACLNWILRNFNQAPPVIREKNAQGVWQDTVDHPVLKLINYPNPFYDGTILTHGIIMSLEMNGNAYVIIERTAGQEVKELWWIPNDKVTPYTKPDSPNQMIVDEYRVRMKHGPVTIIPPRDMIHLTYGRDPLDPRVGLSPLASLARDVNTLQQVSNYKPSILRNFGVIGKWISPKNNDVEIDPDEIKKRLDAQSQGDNAGSTVVMDFAADVQFPGVSPKDMDLGGMGDQPESNILACFGLHAQLLGLYSGRLQKTDASIKEHREEAWEGKLIPLGWIIACQLGNRLLAEFAGTDDPVGRLAYIDRYRMEYDYSNIRPLQPDLDALNRRELLAFQAGITNVGQFCENTRRQKPEADRAGLYWQDINAVPATNTLAIGDGAAPAPVPAGKGLDGHLARIDAELAELERLHAGSDFIGATNGNGVHA